MIEEREWYLTESGVFTYVAIQMIVWLVLILLCVALLGSPGAIIGHFVGCVCALCGLPGKWILD